MIDFSYSFSEIPKEEDIDHGKIVQYLLTKWEVEGLSDKETYEFYNAITALQGELFEVIRNRHMEVLAVCGFRETI